MIALKRLLLGAIVFAGTFQATCFAQGQPGVTSKQRGLASQFVRGRVGPSAEAEQAVDAVVRDEILILTNQKPSAEDMAKFGKVRINLFNSYLSTPPRDQNAAAARTVLINSIMKYCGGIVGGNFKPAAKVVAMSMIAELDETPTAEYPRPAPQAFGRLFTVSMDANQPAYLRAIALYGLERHLGINWPAGVWDKRQQDAIVAGLVKIADSEPKNAMDLKTNAWLVRRAYDCLGTIRKSDAVAKALTRLGDPKQLPSIRLSALSYIQKTNIASLTDEQKSDYIISIAHYLRSQLVMWYEYEDSNLKRLSGATGGSMGGYGGMGAGGGYGGEGGYGGMGAGGGYGGEGGYGGMGAGGGYGGEGGYGGMDGGGMGGYGGYGGEGGGARQPKPKDTQTWETRIARRKINEITQVVHLALDGKATAEARDYPLALLDLSNAAAKLTPELSENVAGLITVVDDFQTAVNDPTPITDINSLLNVAEAPIEEIMLYPFEITGFAERYPEIVEEEGLDTVPEAPKDPDTGGTDGEPGDTEGDKDGEGAGDGDQDGNNGN